MFVENENLALSVIMNKICGSIKGHIQALQKCNTKI